MFSLLSLSPKNLLSVEKTVKVSVVSFVAETVGVVVSGAGVVCSTAKIELLVKKNKENN